MATRLKKGLQHLGGLVASNRSSCSLGRVAFWIVFGLTIYFWLAKPVEAFPSTMEQILMFLLAYNLGGKVVHQFSGQKRKSDDHREI